MINNFLTHSVRIQVQKVTIPGLGIDPDHTLLELHYLLPILEIYNLYHIIIAVLQIRRDNYPYFPIKTYVVTHHQNRLIETVLRRVTTYVFVEK